MRLKPYLPLVCAVACVVLAACGGSAPATPTPPIPSPSPTPDPPLLTIFAAGDIADCNDPPASHLGSQLTAVLLDRLILGVTWLFHITPPGDLTYPRGHRSEFDTCYDKTWGQYKEMTYPAPGNHEYETRGAEGYFSYFGARAVPPLGYYAYTVRDQWLVLSLNSSVSADTRSPQYAWVQDTLKRIQTPCTLAYWHYPLVSSGPNGNQPDMHHVWRLLIEQGGDVVIAAHDHLYEQFEPLDADLRPTSEALGIRSFVVGTGGAPLSSFLDPKLGSKFRLSRRDAAGRFEWGVIQLDLHPKGYAWKFYSVNATEPRDSGTGKCR